MTFCHLSIAKRHEWRAEGRNVPHFVVGSRSMRALLRISYRRLRLAGMDVWTARHVIGTTWLVASNHATTLVGTS